MSTVLLVHEGSPRTPSLRTTLESLQYAIVGEISEASALHAEVVRLAPDLIVACTQSPSATMIEGLRALSAECPRPVVVFADDPRRGTIRKAVEAGVSAYVVDGSAPERITPIIEAACARFEAHEAVRKELVATRNKLSDRKLIEKAKGIVMQQRGLTADQAYGALRKMAMDQNLALAEVARRVISVATLLA
jgi:response regulator NasT